MAKRLSRVAIINFLGGVVVKAGSFQIGFEMNCVKHRAGFYHAALTQHCSKLNLSAESGINPDKSGCQIHELFILTRYSVRGMMCAL